MDVVDRLRSVVDVLVGLDDGALADAGVLVALSRELARVEVVVCRQSAAFGVSRVWSDAGVQNPAAWITSVCRVQRVVARRRVRVGKALAVMQLVDASAAAGRITVEHVEVLSRARDRSKATAHAFGRDQAVLVSWAESSAFHQFVQRVDEWVRVVDAEGAEEAAERVREGRRLHASRSVGGVWFVDAMLDPVDGEIVDSTLTAIVEELFDADWGRARTILGAAPTGAQLASLTRSPAQRRADALVEMAARARTVPVDGRRPAPLFTVVLGAEEFARTVRLGSGASTTPGRLSCWLDDAVIERVVFDGPARVLEVGAQRAFRGALRRAIQVRGESCSHDMCDEPALRCELDHIDPSACGGDTTQANGRLWCRFHHRLHHDEHHPGFRTRRR